MAKVTIVIEDNIDGSFKLTSTPPVNELVAKHKSGHRISVAEAQAVMAIYRAICESKERRQKKNFLNIV